MEKPRKTRKKSVSSVDGGFTFDQIAADKAVDFCARFLTHQKGEWAGKPMALEAWQRKMLSDIFGWKRPDGTRRYRKVFLFVPRKNGKTTLGAAIALYLLFADGEAGAEVYSVAADRDQAAIMFEIAQGMVQSSPALAKRCEVFRRSIVVQSTGSAYHVLSADAPTKHGKNSHAVLFDELHAQPNRELYDVMRTSMGSRKQPLFLMFTTAGYDRQSVCYEEYQYACGVRDGSVKDDSYLPVIFECREDQGLPWDDESTWEQGNPGLGISIQRDFLKEECRLAKESAAYQNTFRRLYLNQWTEQDVRWLDIDTWDRNGNPIDWSEYEGKPCYAGLDLASTSDITSLCLIFPDDDGGYSAQWHQWVPEETMNQRTRKDNLQYRSWTKQGLLNVTEGNVTDYDVIREHIRKLCERYRFIELAYDRWNSSQLITQLQEDGAPVVPFGQGYQSMAAPTKELDRLLKNGQFRHGGNPVLRWMAGNVSVRQDPAGNLKPAKDKSADKIDGIVAAIMALGRAIVSEVAQFSGDYVTYEAWS